MLLPYEHVDPDEVSIFEATGAGYAHALGNTALHTEVSIAELLLQSPSTAIMHYDKPLEEASEAAMLAINYHGASSEGFHKIVVQNPAQPEVGQWELWIPPGSDNKTFYRRSIWSGEPYPYEQEPTNPEKVTNYYMHAGLSDEAIESFRALGFTFTNDVLADSSTEYARLQDLARANPYTWNSGM
jgi:hypothetical protein